MKTPVVFLVFNRPDSTEKVLNSIREVQPSQLLVIADGPRQNQVGEAEKCAKVREIIDTVDWECEVLKNFSDINLGPGIRIATGIDWVFKKVEEAIFLEDDCLPNYTFFQFCEELLEYYRDDKRIMSISGNNFLFKNKVKGNDQYSYFFSKYHHCWGWASWRRAWSYYDYQMSDWDEVRDNDWLSDIFSEEEAFRYWKLILNNVHNNQHVGWDYRWFFTCWLQNGLSVVPYVNLVTNIGHGKDATHTTQITSLANIPSIPISFPLKHPNFMIVSKKADQLTQKYRFGISKINTCKFTLKEFFRLKIMKRIFSKN
ncbi:glycosyltransferase family 2 protein [Acaryochloris sp. IP29b_bin.148]|uniref:glycosyltransferase family 2 protein n=1 Tax=Acaryochloris sp. IP29b_bin.148 TaxID=2969218 RepID=UPI00261CD9BE|nr:glycosyltransferase family 2 protein [Acaryochloris sp. IP29b_bin.148]